MVEHRQLAAIVFTDIVGYTTLMSADESKALRALKQTRKLVQRLARRLGGRWLESVGDGNLLSFPSATDAVNCALAIQGTLSRKENVQLRVGIHVGDVIEAAGHIYGDGVNVASRIHALADPGGIVVSEPVYDAVRNKAGIEIERLGVQEMKGLDHPIQVYALSGEAVDAPLLGAIDLPEGRRWAFTALIVGATLAVLVSTGIYTRYDSARAGDRSIAVLPFKNLSPETGDSYFAEGISEELINKLSRVPGLRVAGSSSSFSLGEKARDVRDIGNKLGVAYVLEGGVRRAAGRVRISTQLVDAESGFQLWAETYETEMDDIFRVQEDIGRSIVDALRLELMPQELADVGRVGTSDVKAYDLYLQARSHMRSADSRQDYDRVLDLIEQSLRRDPTFAEAEAAKCEALVGKYRQTRDSELMSKAVEICNRALTMDPQSALAHIALGSLYMETGRPEFAVESFAKAMPLDPNNADIYLELASALTGMGRVDDAVTYFELALSLTTEPASTYAVYGAYMAKAGRYEKSVELLRKATELDPDLGRAYANLGAVFYFLSRFEDAEAALRRVIELDPSNDRALNNLGAVLFFRGDYRGSLEMLRRAARLTPDDARFVGGMADACRLVEGCGEWRDLYRKALDAANERLSVNPDDAHAMALKAVYLYHLGRKEEGRRLVERAVERDSNDVNVPFNAAIFWSLYGDRDRAEEYVTRAKEMGYPASELEAHPDIVLQENR